MPKAILFHLALLLGSGLSTAALAVNNPTWVSATGADQGNCPQTAPCATFQYAVNKTTAGGTIYVANSGSYGTVNITKAISIIVADGLQATVYTPPGATHNPIEINPGSGSIVVIRGLSVIGHSAETAGYFPDIQVDSGRVSIENCILTGGNWGIYATNPDFLLIKNNRIANTARGIENHTNVSTIYIGKNTITLNDYALIGSFHSYGDNTMSGNDLCDICNATITATPFDQ